MRYDNKITKKNNAVVTISKDRLEAYLYLCPPLDEMTISDEEIFEILEDNNIQYGILCDVIRRIVDEEIFYQEILIAKGKKAIHGDDGFYKILFNTDFNKKPKLLEDGSVDYHSLKLYELVSKGQEIVRYYPATAGLAGIDVNGKAIPPKNGKDLPVMKGSNITISDDNRVYTSNINGKIEYIKNTIKITDIIMVDGDVDITNGDIDFDGDVSINGNVQYGMVVRATGSVYVNGYVEMAKIYAGKDIILRNGMQGGNKGIIEAGGNVSGKFFENTMIKSGENVNSNAIMNCKIEARGRVEVSGKYGIILGGYTYAIEGILATSIGNGLEVRTALRVGAPKEWYMELNQILNQIKERNSDLQKIDLVLKKLYLLKEKIIKNEETRRKWIKLEHTQEIKNKELFILIQKKDELVYRLKQALKSEVDVRRTIYPGSKILIHGEVLHITREYSNINISRDGNEINIVKVG